VALVCAAAKTTPPLFENAQLNVRIVWEANHYTGKEFGENSSKAIERESLERGAMFSGFEKLISASHGTDHHADWNVRRTGRELGQARQSPEKAPTFKACSSSPGGASPGPLAAGVRPGASVPDSTAPNGTPGEDFRPTSSRAYGASGWAPRLPTWGRREVGCATEWGGHLHGQGDQQPETGDGPGGPWHMRRDPRISVSNHGGTTWDGTPPRIRRHGGRGGTAGPGPVEVTCWDGRHPGAAGDVVKALRAWAPGRC